MKVWLHYFVRYDRIIAEVRETRNIEMLKIADLDQTVFPLLYGKFKSFIDLLKRAATRKQLKMLRQLLKKKSPWEK